MEAGLKVRQHYPKGSCIIRICDHVSGDYQGTVYFPQHDLCVSFPTVWGLIKQIEADIAKNGYPQNTLETRRWTNKPEDPKNKIEKTQHSIRFDRTVCSFLVHIRYFQNAT